MCAFRSGLPLYPSNKAACVVAPRGYDVSSPVAGLAPLTVDQSLDWHNVCGRHTSCSSLRYARPQPLDKSPRKARLCERILSGSRRRGEGKGAGSRGPLRISPLSRRAVGLSASPIRHAGWRSHSPVRTKDARRRTCALSRPRPRLVATRLLSCLVFSHFGEQKEASLESGNLEEAEL
jgi:hypothetical protein